MNTFLREGDLDALPDYLQYLQDIQVDGIIISDPGVMVVAGKWAPNIPVHLSTQANTTNSLGVLFWQNHGVRRVNLARETTFEDLTLIRRNTAIELEIFIHGAMCVSYSGRCLLSAFLNDRSANLGLCTQPCRWSYRLVEEKRPGEYFPIFEDSRGTYIFNSKDLCLLDELGKLMALGITSFKIEGRMKSALYLASVVRAYRQAIDQYWKAPEDYEVDSRWSEDLARITHRPYTKGLLSPESNGLHQAEATANAYIQTHTLAGIVRSEPEKHWEKTHGRTGKSRQTDGWACIEVRSRLDTGMQVELLSTNGDVVPLKLDHFEDLQGNTLTTAHPNTWIRVPVSFPVFPLQVVRMPYQAQGSGK